MGRESRFEPQPNSWYPTDRRALNALLPFLAPGTLFLEPCAGDGRLVEWLQEAGHHCVGASDIAPRVGWVLKGDARFAPNLPPKSAALTIITNPPYTPRELMHELLAVWLARGWACWLLIDATWMQTAQAGPWLRHCPRIVAAGRMKMFEDSAHAGKKDHCWFYFTPGMSPLPGPTFWPLGATPEQFQPYETPADDAAAAARGGPAPGSNLVWGEASRPAHGAEAAPGIDGKPSSAARGQKTTGAPPG